MAFAEGPPSSAQCNALVVALIYERGGESNFGHVREVNWRTIEVLKRRGLMEAVEGGSGARLTDAGRALAKSLKGEL